MTLSKRDVRRIKQALAFAIDYEESYIESHRTAYAKGDDAYLNPMLVPKEFKQIVAKAQRNIVAWRLLMEKIDSHNAPHKPRSEAESA